MHNILVIDDNAEIRKLFGRFLTTKGYTVDFAEDGMEGIACIETKHPDLIITDIMMPKMDGLEFIFTLRKQHPDLPIIAISGGLRDIPVAVLDSLEKFPGCKVYYKPVKLAVLNKGIQELLVQPASQ